MSLSMVVGVQHTIWKYQIFYGQASKSIISYKGKWQIKVIPVFEHTTVWRVFLSAMTCSFKIQTHFILINRVQSALTMPKRSGCT